MINISPTANEPIIPPAISYHPNYISENSWVAKLTPFTVIDYKLISDGTHIKLANYLEL